MSAANLELGLVLVDQQDRGEGLPGQAGRGFGDEIEYARELAVPQYRAGHGGPGGKRAGGVHR